MATRAGVLVAALLPIATLCSAQTPATIEQLVVIRPDGVVVGTSTGNATSAPVTPDLDRALRTPGAQLRLTHTHPGGTSLSAADIGQLAKPGVATIEAIGNDGSRYVGAATRMQNPACVESHLHPLALAAMVRQLRYPASSSARHDFDAHLSHLVALALAKAGALSYRAELGATRKASFMRHRITFGRAVESVAAALRNERVKCAGPTR